MSSEPAVRSPWAAPGVVPAPPLGGGPAGVALVVYAAVCVGFHLWLAFAPLVPNLVSRPLHMGLALPWVFLLSGQPLARGARGVGAAVAATGIVACLWVVLERDALGDQYGTLEGQAQLAAAVVLLAVTLEMARRAIKLALPAIAVVALLYGALGQHVPGEFGHPGIPLASLLGTLTIAEGGLWGPLTGISVGVVAIFVILGALVGAGEAGTGFMALATWLAGGLRAGAAKVSILASALFGSISGSASANVASTGAVTLPTMRRLGYPPAFAAAVEAVASSGGQIMPPLMGAGAFVMVELLQTRYTAIMTAAVLPALLFFWTTWAGVDRFAARHGLRPMAPEERPGRRDVATTVPFFMVPFAVLLWLLFAEGYTPQYAAAVGALAALALLVTDRTLRPDPRAFVRRLSAACVDAARQIATIAAIILCAGIVIGVLNLTGLGVKVTSAIVGLSGGNLPAALVLTALACLVLGMEVPTTAAYVICVSVAGPALQDLGLPALHAHLFVFWYALLSTITPPVCGTVFIAAGMAGTSWLPVAGRAMRLGLGLYVVPLAFVANPALLAPDRAPFLATLAVLKVGLGLWLASRALIPDRGHPLVALAAAAASCGVIFAFGVEPVT
ncbi:MAG: TRAP transporter fused permease subunit [Ectothiorhodospiraceae bacterium]|nr:TRAP transporter fused permease subunit [Ectothiorhodospiraceae bacterium]